VEYRWEVTTPDVDKEGERHDMLVGDETGEPILAATFAHDERELTALPFARSLGSWCCLP